MAGATGPFYLVRAGTGRFLCYWGPDGTVYVTDAMRVWAGELGGCPALGSVPAGGARRNAQGRSGSRGRRAEPSPGFGHAAAAGGAAVPGPGPRSVARRRGVQSAAGAGLRHGSLHREPGEAPGRSVVGLEEERASSFCHLHEIVTPTPPFKCPRCPSSAVAGEGFTPGGFFSLVPMGQQKNCRSLPCSGWPVLKAGQGLHQTSAGRRDPAWAQRTQWDLESFWNSSSLDGSAERRMGLIGVEGAHWGGLKCCLQNWGMLSQALALAPVSIAVETLASSCSPEKNAARSQQLFLPDSSPRKSRASDSALPAKRKVPGESLINPGFKSKKAPSGVNFEDS